jgi:hypothetical protein
MLLQIECGNIHGSTLGLIVRSATPPPSAGLAITCDRSVSAAAWRTFTTRPIPPATLQERSKLGAARRRGFRARRANMTSARATVMIEPRAAARKERGAMKVNEMIQTVVERIQALEPDREHRALSEHLVVTSPVALELLAYEHLRSPSHEARRVAAIQLRVVIELGAKLRWLEGVCIHAPLEPGVRVAVAGVLRSLCTESDTPAASSSEAAAWLEPALLFHCLVDHLRPWLPPLVVALEPESVTDLLRLGIPDYLRPLVRRRFEALWALFHQLRQLPPARLAVAADPPRIDDERLVRLLDDPTLASLPCPPAPAWRTPSWAVPWLGDDSPLRDLPDLAGLDLAG